MFREPKHDEQRKTCDVCGEPNDRGEVWGHWLCYPCIDSLMAAVNLSALRTPAELQGAVDDWVRSESEAA